MNKQGVFDVTLRGAVLAIGFLLGVARGDDEPKKQEPPAIVGRWDMTVHSSAEDYPSWLEVRQSGYRTLVGTFVGRTGSARPISRIEFEGDRIRFTKNVKHRGQKFLVACGIPSLGRVGGFPLGSSSTGREGQS